MPSGVVANNSSLITPLSVGYGRLRSVFDFGIISIDFTLQPNLERLQLCNSFYYFPTSTLITVLDR